MKNVCWYYLSLACVCIPFFLFWSRGELNGVSLDFISVFLTAVER